MTDKEERAAQDGAQEAQHDTHDEVREELKELVDAFNNLESGDTLQVSDTLYTMFRAILNALDLFSRIEQAAQNMAARERINAVLTKYRDAFNLFLNLPPEIAELFPYILEEIKESEEPNVFDDKTVPDVFKAATEFLVNGYDKEGNPTSKIFAQALERARKKAEQAANEDQTATDLQKLNSITPTQHIMPNNALMNELAGIMGNLPINAGEHDLTVIPAKGKQDEITVFVMATCNIEDLAQKQFALTEYERNVSDAVMSIWEQAQKEKKLPAFTADTLYQAMPGRGERASTQQKGAMTKAIERLRHLEIEIDATDELHKRGVIADNDTYHIKNFYLQAEEHEFKTGKAKPTKAWILTAEPLILKYAKTTGQILTVSSRFLAIEKVKKDPQGKVIASGEILPMTEQRQAMTSYMLRRIAVMKHDNDQAKEGLRKYQTKRKNDPTLPEKHLADFRKQSDIISFDTLFTVTGTNANTREMARKNKNFCFSVLDFWQLQPGGMIQGYEKQTKGREITGIKILLEPPAKQKKSRE